MLVVLQKVGFAGREAFFRDPAPGGYYLTDDGKELLGAILLPLLQWTMKRENLPSRAAHRTAQRNTGTTDIYSVYPGYGFCMTKSVYP
jgi:hypothetical protein